ncbi:MAG: GSCFA domain-containing protein [Saprospiraceae bacterium]
MSEFRTRLPQPHPGSFFIGHQDVTLCMGSCFATHIGAWMKELKFPCLLNPFGILYNPVSIGKNMQRLLAQQPYSQEDFAQQGGLWHSFDHHGVFSHPDLLQAVSGVNAALQEAATFTQQTNRLILTPGSAHVYTFKKTGQVVANCHKFPASDFEKRRLGVGEVVAALSVPIEQWKAARPDLEIILTISPVRHIRDGIVENQRSKATLALALEELCRQFPYAHYFPAYELLLDDLRDYRFYEADMVHPNGQAIRYIRDYFAETFFTKDTLALNQRIAKIISAANHRPLHPHTPEHLRFVQQQLAAIAELEKEFPFLDFDREKG